MIWIPEMPHRSLEVIFGAILKGFLTANPTKGLEKYASQIVRSSIEIYSKVTLDLLPTPSKSHYTFNLRDLSKIFQGILQIPYGCLPDKETLLNLWVHENQRVFYDRLVD
jgi:dynein heavy chain